jgi:glutamate racemase
MTTSDILPPATPAGTDALGEGLHIGLFDSGLGGLSILRALQRRMPRARLSYVADSANAPYGERDDAFIAGRSLAISEHLLSQGAQAIVVACNTATAMAVHTLRSRWPDVPIVGVEPGVKPAVAVSTNKRVGVLATPGTLASEKFRRLIELHGQDAVIVPQPCPGLAKEIEAGELDTPALRTLIERFSQPLRQAQVDTVALGCTHYPFVLPLFQQALGDGIRIIDTAEAVARQVQRVCAGLPALPDASTSIQLWTTGSAPHLAQVAERWLDLKPQVRVFP